MSLTQDDHTARRPRNVGLSHSTPVQLGAGLASRHRGVRDSGVRRLNLQACLCKGTNISECKLYRQIIVESGPRRTQIFGQQASAFLADEQSRGVSVRAEVVLKCA